MSFDRAKKSPPQNDRRLSPVRKIAAVGIMAATLECGKLALAFLPNIEVVSILLALYGYVFGGLGVMAAAVFCAVEPMIWGFGPWVVSYFLYWPTIPMVFYALSVLHRKRRHSTAPLTERTSKNSLRQHIIKSLEAVGIIFVFTLWFGVLSSLIEVGLFFGSYDRFLWRFGIYYLRGVPFYITHVVSNCVVFALLFVPLCYQLEKAKSLARM